MLDFIKQTKLHPFRIPEDAEFENTYQPDFSNMSMLYKEFGINNDIDLAIQKPQYRDIINSRLSEVPANSSPNLDDSILMDNMISRELDANELREYAISQGKQFKND